MPYKKNYRRRKPRRRGRKVALYRSPRTILKPGASPFPKSLQVSLKYEEAGITIDPPTAGLAASHVFSANGLFDPDITGTGHQPMGLDQLMDAYDHYTVIGAKMTVKFMTNASATPTGSYNLGIRLSDTNTPVTGQTRIREAGLNRWGSITQSSGNAALISLTKGYSTRSFFGLSRGTVMARADLKGTIAANPAEQCFFHIWAAAFDGTSNPTPVLLNVSIVYSAIFSEPRLLVQS